jgi:hypothetical protein
MEQRALEELAKQTDEALVDLALHNAWLSMHEVTYAEFVWMSPLVRRECKRRGKPELFDNAVRNLLARSQNHVAASNDEHERIARLAYRYWEERGRPDGSPQQDWFRAEHNLKRYR